MDSKDISLMTAIAKSVGSGGGGGGGQDYSTFIITATELFDNYTAPVDRTREEIEAAISAGRPIAFRQNLGSPYVIPLGQQLSGNVMAFYWEYTNTLVNQSGINTGAHNIYKRYLVMWNSNTEPYAVEQLDMGGSAFCFVKQATLQAGQTELTIVTGHAVDNLPFARLEVYTDKYGINPTNVSITDHGVATLTFEAQQTDVEVILEVKY